MDYISLRYLLHGSLLFLVSCFCSKRMEEGVFGDRSGVDGEGVCRWQFRNPLSLRLGAVPDGDPVVRRGGVHVLGEARVASGAAGLVAGESFCESFLKFFSLLLIYVYF